MNEEEGVSVESETGEGGEWVEERGENLGR